jgi:crotonobetainyl-CoA:carnitine CoA-transferase CaiB-like acyl-CoA transferase
MSSTQPLRGVRVVSLALNLPGPAALMRLAQMGASCTKVNPPSGDPMQHYTPDGYALMHKGVKHHTLDLKTAAGQAAIHKLLPKTDVLIPPLGADQVGPELEVAAQTIPRAQPDRSGGRTRPAG